MHRSHIARGLILLLTCTALLVTGCDSAGSNGGDPPPSDPTDPTDPMPGTIDGTIRSDSTLTSDQDYVVSGLVSVQDGATLTIEPGTHLRFESGAGLIIGSNSALTADGRADAPIRMTATEGNEEAGWWAGIGVYSGTANNLLDHVEVRHAGGSVAGNSLEAANVIVGVDAALSVTNSTIAESAAYGLYLDKAEADLDTFANNTFADNADAPVYIPFSEIGDLDSDSSFPSRSTVRIRGTLLSSDATVDSLQGNTPYRFTNGNAEISDDATLTVKPGVEMTFASGVGLINNATLSAEGTAANPITMTATAGNEEAGWWAGVGIYSDNPNNLLDHVEVRHAGGTVAGDALEAANVVVGVRAALTLTNSTIAESGAFGIYLDKADADLEGFSDNSFSDNADAPVYIPFDEIGDIDTASTFADGTTVRVLGTGLSGGSVTVDPLRGDTPYRFTSTPAVNNATEMTIEPGVEMTFASDVGFQVQSTLSAEGTAADPITMTATAGNARRGWWRGIGFYSDNPNNLLEHVAVRHAGRDNLDAILEAANVAVAVDAVLELSNSTVTESGRHGVFCDGNQALLTGSGNTVESNDGQNVKDCS